MLGFTYYCSTDDSVVMSSVRMLSAQKASCGCANVVLLNLVRIHIPMLIAANTLGICD